jgi:hypothetical protein
MYPSEHKLVEAFGEVGLAIRGILTNKGYSKLDKLEVINETIGGFGVEYIAQGHNQKSPAIEYVNMGDTYATTILYVNGKFKIGNWGDIVERSNYN